MKKLKKEFNIVFSGLKLGSHEFKYNLTREFFEEFGFEELLDQHLTIEVKMNKTNTLLEFDFSLSGEVSVLCDVNSEPFWMPVSNAFELLVKFGDTYNNDDDEILILPHGAYEVNIAQYIFELAALSIPAKRMSPEAEKELEEWGGSENDIAPDSDSPEEDQTIDPRWNKLKDLLN